MPTLTAYHNFTLKQNNGLDVIDLDTDTIRMMIVTSVYTPSQALHDFISDADANEVTAGTSYTAKGPAIAGASLTLAAGTTTFTFNNVVVAQDATGFTNGRYAILYKDTGVNTTSPVIGYLDFATDKSVQGGSLTIAPNGTTGAIQWTTTP